MKNSVLFNLDFDNNSILSCFFFFFLIIDLYFLIPVVIMEIFNPIAELLVIPIGKTTKEEKAKMEVRPVIVEITINVQYNSNLYKLFYTSYSLIHFELIH